MSTRDLHNFKYVLDCKEISQQVLCGLFCAENMRDLIDIFYDCLEENGLDLLFNQSNFISRFNMFFFTFEQELIDLEDKIYLKSKLNNLSKIFKKSLAEYHKENKSKDGFYFKVERFINEIKKHLYLINNSLVNSLGTEEYKTMWFIINELKNPDYVFYILSLHPEYVNLKNFEQQKLFINLLVHYLAKTKNITHEENIYYKRIIVMLLESEELVLSNEELNDIMKMLENIMKSSNKEEVKSAKFVLEELDRHFENLNASMRTNAISCNKTVLPINVPKISLDNRIDLTDLFTVSIDSVANIHKNKILIDDAYSYEYLGNGVTRIYVHVPDVDEFIPKDSEADKCIHNFGESLYTKEFKRPLIDYKFAKNCSLDYGEKRPAITFIIDIDSVGNLVDINFIKSIVRTNYNLSKHKANTFMNTNDDERLFVLNKMYQVAKLMRKKRGNTIGKRPKPFIIMDEFNIAPDLYTASYFLDKGIIFPYKNFLGKKCNPTSFNVQKCASFVYEEKLSETQKQILYSIFDTKNRIFYDTINHGHSGFGKQPMGNVGNPLREYISLETLRLIKEIVIDKSGNMDYWIERIETDCIDYTETIARIKTLYLKH